MVEVYTEPYTSLHFTVASYQGTSYWLCDLTYRVCSNIDLLCRSLYVPLWVEGIRFVGSVLIVITILIMIGGLYLQFYCLRVCRSLLFSTWNAQTPIETLLLDQNGSCQTVSMSRGPDLSWTLLMQWEPCSQRMWRTPESWNKVVVLAAYKISSLWSNC